MAGNKDNKTSAAKDPKHLNADAQAEMRRAKKLTQKRGLGRKHLDAKSGNLLAQIVANSHHHGADSVLNRRARSTQAAANAAQMREVAAYSSRSVG